MEAIQYVGVADLTPMERAVVDDLSTHYYDKVQRMFQNLTSIKIHVKEYEKGGARKKYSIHIEAMAPTRIFKSTKAHDWDIARCLHESFNDLMTQIEHAFKKENKHKIKRNE